jgi:3-oxoacyl-[acyl-carrier-protein] synthase III
MSRSKILSCGSYFPKKVISNFDLMKQMDTTDEWIYERSGIKNRRLATSEEMPSDLAYKASVEAIERAGLEVNDIDYILFSITFSEQSFPNTAAKLQDKLGITNNCTCLDINAACTGWMYGLELADILIRSGKYKNVLLVGGEKTSTFVDYHDRNTGFLFGDGCGVTIISATEDSADSKILDVVTECNSTFMQDLVLINGGAIKPFTVEDLEAKEYPHTILMNGKVIFKEAVRTMEKLVRELLERHKLTLEDIDWFIPHQANARIIDALGKRLQIDLDKVFFNIEEYGNTSSATIPTTLYKGIEEGKIKRGDRILMSAFGAGLTSSAAILTY